MGRFVMSGDSNAVALAVGETQRCQPGQAFGLGVRAFGPVPDEQTDSAAQLGAQLFARHQSGHSAASVKTSGSRLHMVVEAPVQFALQGEIEWLGKLPGYAIEIRNVPAPVMPVNAISTAEQLQQLALAKHQGDSDTIHLGLNPDVLFAVYPLSDCLIVGQFVDASVRDGMGYRPAGTGERVIDGLQVEATLKKLQALSALVVDLVCHQ
ncbi:hypothetical protein D3C81_1133180 [compost metagenome]